MICGKNNLSNPYGLTDAEYKGYFKMVGDVAPFRRIHGRSKNGIPCVDDVF